MCTLAAVRETTPVLARLAGTQARFVACLRFTAGGARDASVCLCALLCFQGGACDPPIDYEGVCGSMDFKRLGKSQLEDVVLKCRHVVILFWRFGVCEVVLVG